MARTPDKSGQQSGARRRWVVKAGSNLVCTGGPLLVRDWMRQVAALRAVHGVEVVWVTSGAISSAVERMRLGKRSRTLDEKQALSAIGQPAVMELYTLALQAVGLVSAQILLTYQDLDDAGRRQNFQGTVERLLTWEATPVLNENDAVATEEIRFGDNDSLSARVAAAVGAERLVILTDVDGLYDADPRTSPGARLIPELSGVPDSVLASLSPRAGSTRGTGGMYSKVKAAREAAAAGVETWLVRGDVPLALEKVAEDEPIGTRVRVPSGTDTRVPGRARAATLKQTRKARTR